MPTSKIRIGLVGVGKIARDAHVPALQRSGDFALVATASISGSVAGVPAYQSLSEMLSAGQELDAISIATPPRGRHAIAAEAIAAGLPVMLEKPPAATLAEINDLADRARAANQTMFTSWHSREGAAVHLAREWLSTRRMHSLQVTWKEDIRRWHPGQDWILAEGGFGVFDPAINAFSIVTALCAEPLLVKSAVLDFPANRQAPIAARLEMAGSSMTASADLDFLQTGPQTWDIVVETDDGTLTLHDGGHTLVIDGERKAVEPVPEYERLYAHFAQLVRSGQSDLDWSPLRLVADAMLIGTRNTVAPFSFE